MTQAKRAVLTRILFDPDFSIEKVLTNKDEEINQRLFVLEYMDKVQKWIERVRIYRLKSHA